MNPVHILIAVITFLLVSGPSVAGMEKESHSKIPGIFFAWVSPHQGDVLVYSDPEESISDIEEHCNTDRQVFLLNMSFRGTKYKCRVWIPINKETGEKIYDLASVTVQGHAPESDTTLFGLFSISRAPATDWVTRRPLPVEISALKKSMQTNLRRFNNVNKQLRIGASKVIQSRNGSRLTFIVPGKIVNDKRSDYYAQRHHVFILRNNVISYGGELPGEPIDFVDVNGDDLPEVIVSEGCDGWCISLWSITTNAHQIATFGGH